VAVKGVLDRPRAVEAASLDVALEAVAEEAVVSPLAPSPVVGIVAQEVEFFSAPPPLPSSGASAPVPRRRNHRRAGASGTCSLRLGCAAQVPPPEPLRSPGPRPHLHFLLAGALAPALSPFPFRRGPDLGVPAPRRLR
jgi:hypothetical protein